MIINGMMDLMVAWISEQYCNFIMQQVFLADDNRQNAIKVTPNS
jgi:hypothetical protein